MFAFILIYTDLFSYTAYCSMKKADNNVMYAYYKDVPVSEDFLSEDQVSILGDNRTKFSVLY